MTKKILLFVLIITMLGACSPVVATAPLPPTSASKTAVADATAIPAPVATETATPSYPPLDPLFPASGAVLGYTAPEGPRTFVHSNLYDFVDGQADTYFAYNFQQVAVQNYMDTAGRVLHVEIWQFAGPADAYGVYSISRSVITAGVGNDGSTTPERRIAFWQNRYYVHVSVTEKQPQGDLESFALAVAKVLPTGGDRPPLLQRLPASGLVANEAIYFHLEITIQNEIFLGGANKLGLGPKTNGLLAHYTLNGQNASLLLIEYPDAQAAAAGLQGLQTAQVDKLVASQANKNLLAAVVGSVDAATAKTLLDQALK